MYATRAGMCSAAVAALVALVTPLPYSADFRPYFTIHDPAFARLAGGALPSASNGLPRLLGITNLYFLKARAPTHHYGRAEKPWLCLIRSTITSLWLKPRHERCSS